MATDSFLNAADSARVTRTFLNLARHDISGWALTGGVAIELHILRIGGHGGGAPARQFARNLEQLAVLDPALAR